mgnify:FL=1
MTKFYSIIIFWLSIILISKSAEIPDNFFKALGQVESGQNPKAIGDNGRSIGIFQIQKARWLDAINFDKTIGGKYENCFEIEYSKKIVKAYLSKYCSNGTFEDWARLWNSGPNWKNKKHLTQKYWNRIKKKLDKLDKIK